MSRKEIFQHEIKTGTTIKEIEIYTNMLNLILAVNNERIQFTNEGKKLVFAGEFLTIEEHAIIRNEINDLKKKIKKYKKLVKENQF